MKKTKKRSKEGRRERGRKGEDGRTEEKRKERLNGLTCVLNHSRLALLFEASSFTSKEAVSIRAGQSIQGGGGADDGTVCVRVCTECTREPIGVSARGPQHGLT